MAEEEEQDGSSSTGDVSPPATYDTALQMGREDTLFAFNEHLRIFEEESAKAGRIAQLDGVVLTIFLSALLATNEGYSNLINEAHYAGVLFLSLGFLLGMAGQISFKVPVGISKVGINELLDQRPRDTEYMEWSLRQYRDWISRVQKKAMWRANIVKASAAVSVIGLLFILTGTYIALA